MGFSLPQDFVLGVSTASHQIEGAVAEGGRGRSIWDDFADEPGRIRDGSSGAVACDHYHRFAEDIGLMRRLGVDAYRFSFAWPRIQPDGTGPANPAGIDFYDRLVDGLLEAGISPAATLFHWDLPSALQATGGWQNRETAEKFGEYAALLGDHFADRVAMWMPVNEPFVVTVLGHALGTHAPGLTLGLDALPVAHHLLLGHGLAVAALRAAGARSVGTASNHTPVWAASDSEADRAAADLYDALHNRLFADPVLLGGYPDGFADLLPLRDGDLATISVPIDFYGLNYYNPTLVGAPETYPDGVLSESLPVSLLPIGGYPHTDFDWPVVPDGLRELLVAMTERYPAMPPVFVTENGCSYDTPVGADGVIDDADRISFLDGHLAAVADAVAAGVDVRGYFHWSLLDNFEWAEGYTQRFGLVHVDFDTQERTPRRSYEWYRDVIAATHRADG